MAGLISDSFLQEHSACGLGFAARAQAGTGYKDRRPLDDGLTMLSCYSHRGKDGAGILMELDHEFYRARLQEEQGVDIGRDFGMGTFFLPQDEAEYAEARKLIEDTLRAYGFPAVAWREVPVNPDALSPKARETQPRIMQVFFQRPDYMMLFPQVFEDEIYRANREIGVKKRQREDGLFIHSASMSSRTVVYKILGDPTEVEGFYQADLRHPDHDPDFAVTHARFSTNTTPRWELAQPRLMIVHNGEINTIDRNERRLRMRRREIDDIEIPSIAGLVDTGWLDFATWLRVIEDHETLERSLLTSMPPVRADISDPAVRAMLEYQVLDYEPFGGPAGIIASDGRSLVLHLDSGGLRPLGVTVTKSGYVVGGSERGILDIPSSEVAQEHSLRGGEFFAIALDRNGQIRFNDDILRELASDQNYTRLVADRTRYVSSEVNYTPADTALAHTEREKIYGWHEELVTRILTPMAATGKEPVIAMGNSRCLPSQSRLHLDMSFYLSQRFAQVTNPPIDPIRERASMSLEVALGKKPGVDREGAAKQIILDSPVLRPGQLTRIVEQGEVKTARIDTTFSVSSGASGMTEALERVLREVEGAIEGGAEIIILSDKSVGKNQAVIPMTLAVAAVNDLLIDKKKRMSTAIIAESGEVANTHQCNLLLTLGAGAVNPHMAYEHIARTRQEGKTEELQELELDDAIENFASALDFGILKTMSKMGVPDVKSYIGSRLIESDSLNLKPGTLLGRILRNIHSPIGGHRIEEIAENYLAFVARANDPELEGKLPNLGLIKPVSKESPGKEVHGYARSTVQVFELMFKEENNARLARFLKDNEDVAAAALGSDKLGDTGKVAEGVRELLGRVGSEDITTLMESVGRLNSAQRAKLAEVIDAVLEPGQAQPGTFSDLIAGPDRSGLQKAPDSEGEYEIFTSEDIDGYEASDAYRRFSAKVEEKRDESPTTVTDMFAVRSDREAISIGEVQSVSSIISGCLTTGNMSDGAIVTPVHEIIATGMNRIGGKSGSGEGGEEHYRYGDPIRGSRIKQVASGRFGVDAEYLASIPEGCEIEIKIAQGAKPGEGGQLPPGKVNVEIAVKRGAIPGTELVSPPPHHDIYSIEDLAQLIYDLRASERRVGVKLVSSQGVGIIATGVAKALADAGLDVDEVSGVVNIAGKSGGTGAAMVTSVHHAGAPGEIGLRDTDQQLRVNGYRDITKLRTSGGMKNGWDLIKATIMGADEAEFGTSAMIALGCVKADTCNTRCPRWIATRHGKWIGQTNDLERYMLNIAAEAREILAQLGYRSLDDIRGRTDLLEEKHFAHMRGEFDFSDFLEQPENKRLPEEQMDEYRNVYRYDSQLMPQIERLDGASLTSGEQIVMEAGRLTNCDRSVGGQVAIAIARHRMANDLSRDDVRADAVRINYTGVSGQSFGVWNTHGMHQHIEGVTQDYTGKGMGGGVLSVQKPSAATYKAEENMIAGNAVLYGARGGEAFFNGRVGDRGGVRASGVTAVFEGMGDWAGSFMTSGTLLNIGDIGRHAGAGASGGVFIQYDPDGKYINGNTFDMESMSLYSSAERDSEYQQVIKELLEKQVKYTNSELAATILRNWEQEKDKFTIVIPKGMEKAIETRLEDVEETFRRRGQVSPGVQATIESWKRATFVGPPLPEDLRDEMQR